MNYAVRDIFGPFIVLRYSEHSAIHAGKWCVESDISDRVRAFETQAEAVKCAQRRYKAWLRRRHP